MKAEEKHGREKRDQWKGEKEMGRESGEEQQER